MRISDIYTFISNYDNTSPEILLQWLKMFSAFEQLCFISLISSNKIKFIKKAFLQQKHKTHKTCPCYKTYDTLADIFRWKIPDLSCLQKCVTQRNNGRQICIRPKTIALEQHPSIRNTTASQLKKYHFTYNETFCLKPPALQMMFSAQSTYGTFQHLEDSELETFAKLNEQNNFAYSLSITIVIKFTHNLEKLLPYLNVLELYTLFIIKYIFSLRDFERLLPEYWRTFNRSSYHKRRLEPAALLSLIHQFHANKLLYESNTLTKATFKLPILIDAHKITQTSDYVMQPRLNGLHLLICKMPNAKISITNEHNVRVKLVRSIRSLFADFPENSFTAEVILMLREQKNNGQWYSKKELVQFLHDSTYCDGRPAMRLTLVVLDLFVWNGINLLSISFEQRRSILNEFIKTAPTNIILCPEFTVGLTQIKEFYKSLLQHHPDRDAHFSGVVFRKKFVNFEVQLTSILFGIERLVILSAYDHHIRFVLAGKKPLMIKQLSDCCVIRQYFKYKAFIVVYKFINNQLFCAVFNDAFAYEPFIVISGVATVTPLMNFFHHHILIEGRRYSWVVIRIYFNELDANRKPGMIGRIDIRPDKSLLDCSTKKDY